MDYRLYYSECTEVIVPDSFEVHHIDLDRENNIIDNLVALPKSLHTKYHSMLPYHNYGLPKEISYINFGHIGLIKTYLEVYEEACKWVSYRDFLIKKIPFNIYKLSYCEKETKIELFKVRKEKFKNDLKLFLETYGRDMLNEFYSFWSEPNKSQTKMRFELERTWQLELRLARWSRLNKKNAKPTINHLNQQASN